MEYDILVHLCQKTNNMRTIVLIFAMFLMASWSGNNQGITIKGTVIDAGSKSSLAGVKVLEKGTANQVFTDKTGSYEIIVQGSQSRLLFSLSGYKPQEVIVGTKEFIHVSLAQVMKKDDLVLEETKPLAQPEDRTAKRDMLGHGALGTKTYGAAYISGEEQVVVQQFNTEDYSPITENIFHRALNNPLSTFAIDVDAASYSNIRRFITNGQLPPKDAVRIEEMINYFHYDYPQPDGSDPFSINTEVAACPWDNEHLLVHIGLQGKRIPVQNLPPTNLVFLLDVSGSMDTPNKLPLLKSAFSLLVNELRPQDRIAIVVYAGAAGLVLPSTPGDQKEKINTALSQLQAGGSTAGGQGIILAYKIAQENLMKEGNNRIILATDGDFNIGASSNGEMERLIEEKRQTGIFLTVLGFGMGNYKDSKMEILADKGNGNYAYIDNILEAKKVLVNEFGGTLFTIAKDVKIQVEFNPAVVQSYRLVGYENRKLNDEDFNNDKKDAGELGSGHTVTAIYEIIPVGVEDKTNSGVDPLKYQDNQPKIIKNSSEIMTVKLRYKAPEGDVSKLTSHIVRNEAKDPERASENLRFSSSVAAFGMLLRDSEFKGNMNYEMVLQLAKSAKGNDEEGYRAEFIKLVESAKLMMKM
jgi:Ca-activated chloride channel family protein